jgi:hypothetical protein
MIGCVPKNGGFLVDVRVGDKLMMKKITLRLQPVRCVARGNGFSHPLRTMRKRHYGAARQGGKEH